MGMTCDRVGCTEVGQHRPVILIWADQAKHGPHPPMELQLGLKVCSEHVHDMDVDSLLLPEAKEKIASFMDANGKAEPNWSSAKLMWTSVS